MDDNPPKFCDPAYLKKLIDDAASELATRDTELLTFNANEACLSHRFAFYLEHLLRERDNDHFYHVDCEYNREGIDLASLNTKRMNMYLRYILDEHGRKIVVPDVIVHKRGPRGPNLMAIEIKTSMNLERQFDLKDGLGTESERVFAIDKLKGYISKFSYYYVALLCFGVKGHVWETNLRHKILYEDSQTQSREAATETPSP